MQSSTDDSRIVVVGAGSTGCSTVYHLSKAGAQAILIDKGQIASGMTSKSSAIARTHYSNEIVARMALYSLRILENFEAIGNSGFMRNGMLVLASSSDKEGFLANLKMLDSIGVKNEILDKQDAKKRFPELDLEDCDFILLEPESGYADPAGTANSYAEKARELGAEIILGQEVTKLETEKGKLSGITLSGGSRINCSKAIICTNVWTNRLLDNSGVARDKMLPLWAVAHPIVVFRRPTSYHGTRPSIGDFPNKTYYKPEGKSLLFAGSIDAELDKQKIEPEECPSEVQFEFMNMFSEVVIKRIPSMAEGVYHSSYNGMYDITPDQHPIIDELSDLGLEGVYSCVGLSGHGFKLCPAFGLMNAEMVLGVEGQDQTFDRSHFSLSRFKTGKLLLTKYPGLATVA